MSMITEFDRGTPRKYVKKTTGDTPGGPLTESERTDAQGNEPTGATITIDNNAARIRVDGGDPDQGNSVGHRFHNNQRSFVELYSLKAIKELRWVSESTGSSANVHITLFY